MILSRAWCFCGHALGRALWDVSADAWALEYSRQPTQLADDPKPWGAITISSDLSDTSTMATEEMIFCPSVVARNPISTPSFRRFVLCTIVLRSLRSPSKTPVGTRANSGARRGLQTSLPASGYPTPPRP